jgi:hypothetical protein
VALLPNAEKAFIEPEKLKDYILSPVHPIGRFKATFFQRAGYSRNRWEIMEDDLRNLILTETIAKTEDIKYGKKYIIEGSLTSPSGQKVKVVTVWVILKQEDIPRFVTVYPRG